jgi:hypothetical protein
VGLGRLDFNVHLFRFPDAPHKTRPQLITDGLQSFNMD